MSESGLSDIWTVVKMAIASSCNINQQDTFNHISDDLFSQGEDQIAERTRMRL